MVLIIICIGIPAIAFSGVFASALLIGISATNREIRENKIIIKIENRPFSNLLNIMGRLTFMSIGLTLKNTIEALIYNKDLRKYLYFSLTSGLIALSIIKFTEPGA